MQLCSAGHDGHDDLLRAHNDLLRRRPDDYLLRANHNVLSSNPDGHLLRADDNLLPGGANVLYLLSPLAMVVVESGS
jgi:hypothetical protein